MWLAGLFVFGGWMVSLCLHEFGHAVVAYFGGDTSVKDKGYLTLNPLNYTDPGLSLLMPMIFLVMGGIALPGGAVYIDHSKLRDRRWDSAVSAAGPFANAVVTVALAIPFWLDWVTVSPDDWLGQSLAFLIFLQIFAVVINLLPIPPLDGYGIIRPWLPPSLQQRLSKLGRYSFWFIFGVLWFVPAASRELFLFIYQIALLLKIPPEAIQLGSVLFTQPATKLALIVGFLGFLWLMKQKGNQTQNASDLHWFNQGNKFIEKQQYDHAIAAYDKAIHINPNLYQLWYNRGLCLAELHQFKEAITSYQKAIKIKPDFYQAWNSLGNSFYHSQQYTEAITAYDHALQLKPNLADTWYNRACCRALQGYADLAIDSLKQAIEINPNFREQAKTDADFESIRNSWRFPESLPH
ncbi:MAG: tetratricopeptide repeat protein [Coleofasciculus sp. B1-GNL1-01]|uniref:tetratricopeptide repeat protein n=1 Tax=Coleofasciculus sp. B1-GNL1-01 TaxID=3068484 RepID=UPI003304C31A